MSLEDGFHRRNRFDPQPIGKRVTLKPRDWMWLRALRDHGPLPAHYLHAFCAATHRNPKASSLRLTDLVSEDNTPHAGPYLCRPQAQQGGLRALNRPLIYDLAPAGWRALEMAPEDQPRPSGPFRHQLMVACVSASIDLACQQLPGLRFIHGRAILERINAPLAVEIPAENERGGRKMVHQRLIPDQLFAIEYTDKDHKQYLAFVIECDRGTEPVTSASKARKSYERNFKQYRQFIGSGLYRKAYGLKSNMLVLNVMNSAQKQRAYMRLIDRLAPQGNTFMLFQTIPGFGPTIEVPPILQQLTQQPWQRVGHAEFNLRAPT